MPKATVSLMFTGGHIEVHLVTFGHFQVWLACRKDGIPPFFPYPDGQDVPAICYSWFLRTGVRPVVSPRTGFLPWNYPKFGFFRLYFHPFTGYSNILILNQEQCEVIRFTPFTPSLTHSQPLQAPVAFISDPKKSDKKAATMSRQCPLCPFCNAFFRQEEIPGWTRFFHGRLFRKLGLLWKK